MDRFFEIVPHSWNGYDFDKLNIDEAYLNITSWFRYQLGVYSLSVDCIECPFTLKNRINTNSSEVITVSTKHNSLWRFYNDTITTISAPYKSVSDYDSLVCELKGNFGEFGVYDVTIEEKRCEMITTRQPVNIYFPLIITCLALVSLFSFFVFGFYLWKCCCRQKRTSSEEHEMNGNVVKKTERFKSVDTFRGLALCLMIFVNDGGGQYSFFNHSTWDGLNLADVLFPWFLWIMGLCVALSQKSLKKGMFQKLIVLKNIAQRTFILFAMGLSLSTLGIGPVNVYTNLRIPGVLQRISICYGIVSSINAIVPKLKVNIFLKDSLTLLPQWLLHSSILCVHIYLTFYLQVPGCPRGYLKAGGIQNDGAYKNCTGGATGYIDRLILGDSRLWQNNPVCHVYHTLPFDSENILGCLTSVFQTFLGLQAGYILLSYRHPRHRTIRFIVWSLILLASGYILHLKQIIPVNKNLWSLSFVFVTSGLGFLLFAIFYQIIDNAKFWNGSPFIYPGMNSILVYVGHEICFQLFPWHWKISRMNTHFITLLENIWGVLVWIIITFVLYRKRIFISV